jgi:hypothetical protein
VGPPLNGSWWPDSQFFLSFVIFYFFKIFAEKKMASDEDEWEKYYSDLVEGL